MEISCELIRDLVKRGRREDNRGFDEYRKIEIKKGLIKNAEGSAKVKLGNTEVIAGVKVDIKEPFLDTPNEGILICDANLEQDLEGDTPNYKEALEVARVVDRTLRHGNLIDFTELCIEEGKKVWCLNLDIAILNNDGNLFDAGCIAGIIALSDTKFPKLDGDLIIREEKVVPLKLKEIPLLISVAGVENTLLVDPNLEEEQASDFILSLGIVNDKICAIQKRGYKGIPNTKLEEIIDLAIKNYKKLKTKIEPFI